MGDAWNIFSILQLFIWMLTTLAGRGFLCLIGMTLAGVREWPVPLIALFGVGCALFWSVGIFRWGRQRAARKASSP